MKSKTRELEAPKGRKVEHLVRLDRGSLGPRLHHRLNNGFAKTFAGFLADLRTWHADVPENCGQGVQEIIWSPKKGKKKPRELWVNVYWERNFES